MKKADKIRASEAEGNVLLAMLCQTLASVHAINPALVYDGAINREIDAKTPMKLADENPVALGDLMFV